MDKNGIFLFGSAVCLAAVFRWHQTIAEPEVDDAALDEANTDDSGSEDSLEDYFEDEIDYPVRDDYTSEDGDGRYKMVFLVNMKLG